MTNPQVRRKYSDGRDEMNLADFPISRLQRQQASDADGRKLDSIVYESTRHDPATRQRVVQRVTLTTQARDGLPTPADEHVILALLYVAKHGTDFVEPTVHYAPSQLFDIMGWAPNGRSYERLREVLRRLKSLTIRYENAWWDAAGRGYEEEVATGIISAYKIARQVSGPKKPGAVPSSWVTWTPQFHESLRNGNIKRLDLDLFFSLSSPSAQRIYRFLDKRFYNHPRVSLDLMEFACGHVGLTECDNVAVLKRRLAPAIKELEAVGFLAAVPYEERFQKVKPGVWRVTFQSAGQEDAPPPAEPVAAVPTGSDPVATLVAEFYRLWDGRTVDQPGPRDREQAKLLIEAHGAAIAPELLPWLVRVVRAEWPDCRSFSGATQKYLADAVRLHTEERERRRQRGEAERRDRAAREDHVRSREQLQEFRDRWQPVWDTLTEAERDSLRNQVLARHPLLRGARHLVEERCLRELARRHGGGVPEGADGDDGTPV